MHLLPNIGDRTRQREDEVEIADGQQFGLALGERPLRVTGICKRLPNMAA